MDTGGYGHVQVWVLGEKPFSNQGCSLYQYTIKEPLLQELQGQL